MASVRGVLSLFAPKKANEEKKNLPCLSGGDRRMTTEKVLISGGDLPSTTFAIFVVYTKTKKCLGCSSGSSGGDA